MLTSCWLLNFNHVRNFFYCSFISLAKQCEKQNLYKGMNFPLSAMRWCVWRCVQNGNRKGGIVFIPLPCERTENLEYQSKSAIKDYVKQSHLPFAYIFSVPDRTTFIADMFKSHKHTETTHFYSANVRGITGQHSVEKEPRTQNRHYRKAYNSSDLTTMSWYCSVTPDSYWEVINGLAKLFKVVATFCFTWHSNRYNLGCGDFWPQVIMNLLSMSSMSSRVSSIIP